MSSFVLEGVRSAAGEARADADSLSERVRHLFQRLNDPSHLSQTLGPALPFTLSHVPHLHPPQDPLQWPVQQRAASPMGGPIARLLTCGTAPKLQLLDAFALPFRSRPAFLPFSLPAVAPGGVGWLQGGQQLAVVSSVGKLLLYQDLPWREAAPSQTSLPGASESNAVVLAHVWAGGVVVLTEGLELLAVGEEGQQVRSRTALPRDLFSNPPRAMAVLQPEVMRGAADGCVVALAHWEQGGVVRVSGSGSITSHVPAPLRVAGDQPVHVKPSVFLRAHPTREVLLSYTTDSKVVVASADFESILYVLDAGRELFSARMLRLPMPVAVEWCGADSLAAVMVFSQADAATMKPALSGAAAAVVGVKEAHALMGKLIRGEALTHDPGEVETQTFALQSQVVAAVCEVDGLRVVCSHASFLIRPTPPSIRSIFGLASCSPAALLYEAVESVACGGVAEVNTDESIQGLAESDEIAAAVDDCLNAAEHVLGADEAQLLIYIAAYGKRFFPLTHAGAESVERLELSKRLRDTSLLCRICAFLRNSNKCFITPKQLRVLTPPRLLNRLLSLQHFGVAFKLCTLIGASPAYVVEQWAKMKIQAGTHLSDQALLDAIHARTDALPFYHRDRMRHASVAAFAVRCGRPLLAKALISKDSSLPSQVLLLLQLQDYEAAIATACADETHDTDLLSYVLLFCAKKVHSGALSLASLHEAVRAQPKARAVLACIWKEQRPGYLEEMLKQLGIFKQHGLLLQEAACLQVESYDRKAKLLALAIQSLKRGEDKGVYKICLEQQRLWEMQHDVADSLVGTSLADTVLDCFKRKQDELAEQFSVEFKMKPALYRRIQLRGLCFLRAWERIDDLSKDKAVLRVISLADFAQVCVDQGNQIEAVKYLLRMDDCAEKATMLLELKMWSDASDTAFNIKDVSILHLILATCTDKDVRANVLKRVDELQAQAAPISSASRVAEIRQCAQQ